MTKTSHAYMISHIRHTRLNNEWICIMQYFILDMKYMCKSCKTTCSNIIQHLKKVHGFSESYIKNSLITNTNSYKNSFEEIK